MSRGRRGKSMTFGESTSRKSSDFEYNMKVVGFGCGPWRWSRGVGEIHMNKGRVGEERGGKEMDGCPLTATPSTMLPKGMVPHQNLPLMFLGNSSATSKSWNCFLAQHK
jgi:hypothetical protein